MIMTLFENMRRPVFGTAVCTIITADCSDGWVSKPGRIPPREENFRVSGCNWDHRLKDTKC